MRTLAIAAGALLTTLAATTASAQVYIERSYAYDPYYARAGDECWNPRAGHYEAVRPGEVQNDLDFSRCRAMGGRYYGDRYGDRYSQRYYRGEAREVRRECWNPRAGHFEEERPGEYQGDLDFSRCRIQRW
jgi:hypothetical protein